MYEVTAELSKTAVMPLPSRAVSSWSPHHTPTATMTRSLAQIIAEDATFQDPSPQRGIACAALGLPNRIAGPGVVVTKLQPDAPTSRGLTATEFPHDGLVATIGPPVEGMLKRSHKLW
jgi:hypothetical protein